jgi:phosphoglycolate phosphatase-like HAD superfamily hydrolase
VAKNSSDKKLILWDIDGTLIVSHGAGVRAMERALREHFGRPGDLSRVDWAGRTDTWIAGEVFAQVGIPDTPENRQAFFEAYFRLLPLELAAGPNGRVLPGVLELLDTLHRRDDVAQGLLTGNLRKGAELKLTHFRVWHYFEFGAFADDSPRRNDLGPHALRRAKERHAHDFDPARTSSSAIRHVTSSAARSSAPVPSLSPQASSPSRNSPPTRPPPPSPISPMPPPSSA